MNDRPKVVTGESIAILICEALGINPHIVSRVVLDLDARFPAVLDITLFGTDALLELDWDTALEEVKLTVKREEESKQ